MTPRVTAGSTWRPAAPEAGQLCLGNATLLQDVPLRAARALLRYSFALLSRELGGVCRLCLALPLCGLHALYTINAVNESRISDLRMLLVEAAVQSDCNTKFLYADLSRPVMHVSHDIAARQ